MMKFSAIFYYLSSIPTLFFNTSFWKIPLVSVFKPLLFHVGRYKFYVNNLMDIWVLKEVIIDRQYELYTPPRKNWIVIDIGAGIADFDILISKKVRRIYAFDSDDNRIFLAQKNIAINAIKNVMLVKKKVKNLKEIFDNQKIRKCNLLKIDCEGCEYSIISSTPKDIFKKINQIVMEAHLFNSSMKKEYIKIKKILQENDFKILEKENPVHSYLKLVYAYKAKP